MMGGGTRHARWLLVLGVSALTACSALVDFKYLTSPDPASSADGAADASQPGDASGVVPGDSATGSSDGGVDGKAFTCPPSLHGPALVAVDSYCIDATEVTNKQYKAFVMANVGTDTQPAFCMWNTSYTPCGEANYADDAPVACVDWCDAYAFCKWSGKRLCGAVRGGALDISDASSSTNGQWYRACSHGGTQQYAYANDWEAGVCNDTSTASAPLAVGSLGRCVGGYPGIFDMIGNVNEWEDSCIPTVIGGSGDRCLIRGGAYDDTVFSGNLGCEDSMSALQTRSTADTTIGIRCCAP